MSRAERDATAHRSDVPTLEQFLILARKVEELEDRVRSLAVNDVDQLRKKVETNQASIRHLKSPRYWFGAGWRRIRGVAGSR